MIGFVTAIAPAGVLTCRVIWFCVWLDAAQAAVHDAMALIGFVFHWSPEWSQAQRYSDLMDWRERALALYNAANGADEASY